MGLPRQLPPGGSSSGHGPFGDKAFKAALAGCVVLILAGTAMALAGRDAVRGVGTAFVVLALVGLSTAALGLVAERRLKRRPPPPPEVRRGNGRGSHPVEVPDGVERRRPR
jgi:hypothetical protein